MPWKNNSSGDWHCTCGSCSYFGRRGAAGSDAYTKRRSETARKVDIRPYAPNLVEGAFSDVRQGGRPRPSTRPGLLVMRRSGMRLLQPLSLLTDSCYSASWSLPDSFSCPTLLFLALQALRGDALDFREVCRLERYTRPRDAFARTRSQGARCRRAGRGQRRNRRRTGSETIG